MALETRNLACVRSQRTLFKNLDLNVGQGQCLLVEGDNGCGKTSLLKMLAGLRPADEGEVLWQQQEIQKLGADYRQQVVWLGHTNGIKEDLTAVENLRVARSLNTSNHNKINDALQRVSLRAYKNTLPRLFSAGMKRRLALARLLLLEAPLWILDEPQAALDKTGIAMFETFVEEHLDNNGMVVMTSHHDVGLKSERIIRLRLSA